MYSTVSLPVDLLEHLLKECPGETVRWVARPYPLRVLFNELGIYFFAIPWTAFSLFWEFMALQIFLSAPEKTAKLSDSATLGMKIIFPLFGIPFVLIGFGMLLKPFLAYGHARKTIYAITNQRALILRGGSSGELHSFSLTSLSGNFEQSRRSDGSGSLFFAFDESVGKDGKTRQERHGFEHIPNVHEATFALQAAMNRARRQYPKLQTGTQPGSSAFC